MPTLGQAYVQIVPSADGISNSISNVLSGPADKAGQDAGSKFGSGFGAKMKNGLMVAGAGVAALGVAAGAAFGKSISDVSQYGDHIDKMSQKIGFSAEGFQKWDYVLQRAGTSIDSMAPVMKKLSTSAVENSDAFQQLGISQEEVANMSQEELFGRTIQALSGMEEGAERTALASKLLGKGASELAPLINGGTDAIEEQMEMAEKYGMVMSDEGVKASADFVDAQTTLSMTMTGLKNRMTAEFLPACTEVTNGIAKMFAGDMSGLEDIKAGIGDFVGSIASHIPEMIARGGEMIAGLISGITERLPEMALAAAEAIKNFADGFGQGSEGGANLLATAGELMLALGTALMESVGIIIPAVIDAIWAFITNTDWLGLGSSVVNGIINAFNSLFPIAIDIVKRSVINIANRLGFAGVVAKVRSIFQSVKERIISPVETARGLIDSAVSKISGILDFAGLVGKVQQIFDDVKQKITSPIDEAKELVDSAVQKILGFFPINVGRILDNISLPHFSVEGGKWPYGIGGEGYMPSFGVDWYARGGVFNGAQVIGVGEAGPEAVVPLSGDRMKPFTDAIAEINDANNRKLVSGMYQAFSAALRDANITVQIGNREFNRILREAGAL